MIKANNIHYSYGKLEVLKGVNLHIKKGEFVSIVGASGAGKTTLLQLLGALDSIQVGSIEINGSLFNVVSSDGARFFIGQTYYVYYLEATT